MNLKHTPNDNVDLTQKIFNTPKELDKEICDRVNSDFYQVGKWPDKIILTTDQKTLLHPSLQAKGYTEFTNGIIHFEYR